MEPTYQEGDHVLVDPRAFRDRGPRQGDVVLVRHPFRRDLELVKRVAHVGDDGRLTLRGDNPAHSTDSRTYGPVDPALVRGRVTQRFGPARPLRSVRLS